MQELKSLSATTREAGPIHYMVRQRGALDISEAHTLYSLADVLFLTPIRDGMNSVMTSYEYIMCRHAHSKCATLLLSEFVVGSNSLGGAMHVNPWDPDRMAEVLVEAVTMDAAERQRRHDQMLHSARNFTLDRWSDTFMDRMQRILPAQPSQLVRGIHLLPFDAVRRLLASSPCAV